MAKYLKSPIYNLNYKLYMYIHIKRKDIHKILLVYFYSWHFKNLLRTQEDSYKILKESKYITNILWISFLLIYIQDISKIGIQSQYTLNFT